MVREKSRGNPVNLFRFSGFVMISTQTVMRIVLHTASQFRISHSNCYAEHSNYVSTGESTALSIVAGTPEMACRSVWQDWRFPNSVKIVSRTGSMVLT